MKSLLIEVIYLSPFIQDKSLGFILTWSAVVFHRPGLNLSAAGLLPLVTQIFPMAALLSGLKQTKYSLVRLVSLRKHSLCCLC